MFKSRLLISGSSLGIDLVVNFCLRKLCFIILGFIFFPIALVRAQPSEQEVRRHYILAMDVSGPFKTRLRSTPQLKNALTDLFKNKIPSSSVDENSSTLYKEKENGVLFFDERQDEITLLTFGISENEIDLLEHDRLGVAESKVISRFVDRFIENKEFSWSSYRKGGGDVAAYLDGVLRQVQTAEDFGYGVTLSNYVYPLVLDKVAPKRHASEYILIVVSDFLTGSQFGNKNDFKRLKEVYRFRADSDPPRQSAPVIIRDYINALAGSFFPVGYFEYAFNPIYAYTLDQNSQSIGVVSFKVKPKGGKVNPEDISYFVDGNLSLRQRKFEGSVYELSGARLRFIHNDKMVLNSVAFRVRTNTDSLECEKCDFEFSLARRDANGDWQSEISRDEGLMAFDSVSSSYFLPQLNGLTFHNENLGASDLKYRINATYTGLSSKNSLKYSYETDRIISHGDVNYRSNLTNLILMYFAPILLLLIILYLLIRNASPKNIELAVDSPLNDSFEVINYNSKMSGKKSGRHVEPYLVWVDKKQHNFLLKLFVQQGNSLFRGLWRTHVLLKLTKVQNSPGFDVFLISKQNKEQGSEVRIPYSKKGEGRFQLRIEQVDIGAEVTSPAPFGFTIEAHYDYSFLFFKKQLHKNKPLTYNFYVGPDLGNIWVGIDPGTTGSCVAAVADGFSDIYIPKDDKGQDLIIPSMITFLEGAENKDIKGESALDYKAKRYYYGEVAKNNSSRTDYGARSFRSIKKMLGYSDTKHLNFTQEPVIQYELNGKDLCSLLVRGIYNDLDASITLSGRREFLNKEGEFKPQRAIVAIPNNFTSSKIQGINDSIRSIENLNEIRCIYEAEANLIYYLFGLKKIQEGNVFLFDMGGATINATLANITIKGPAEKKIYHIEILGKLGYGIGGDTIDYLIIKFLAKSLPSVGVYSDPFDFSTDPDLKNRLVEMALNIKVSMIERYAKGEKYLIENYMLESYLKGAFGADNVDEIRDDSEIMAGFIRKGKSYPFFEDEVVQSLLYSNIETIVQDIVKLSNNPVDHLIFSGRSSAFPKVHETVINRLPHKLEKANIHSLDVTQLKSAVAKGACLYGFNRSRIRLTMSKVNSWFGVRLNTSATDFEFIELVRLGKEFESNGEGLKYIKKRVAKRNDFGFDSHVVNFYQIMGIDPIDAFEKDEKHKFSLVKQVKLSTETRGLGIEVWENDDVFCEVVEQGAEEEQRVSGEITDYEIGDANQEHYTWIIE